MKNTQNGAQILICGSQNFEFSGFVHNTLDLFNLLIKEQFNSRIKQIYTSQVSGACEFARDWIDHKNESLPDDQKIRVKDYTFSLLSDENNSHIFDELEIPQHVLENDEFFIKGKEKLQSLNVQYIVAFPNPDGIIGAHTQNILRFAKLADVKVLDASVIMARFIENNLEQKNVENNEEVEVVAEAPALGLQNHHRARVLR